MVSTDTGDYVSIYEILLLGAVYEKKPKRTKSSSQGIEYGSISVQNMVHSVQYACHSILDNPQSSLSLTDQA